MATVLSFAFPFSVGEQNFPKEATDADAIKASIIQIVTTAKGERVMRPDFGCSAFDFVFEGDSDTFRALVEREIRMSITTWEPRVRIDSVAVTTNPETEPGQILITIYYTIVSAGIADSVTVAGGL